MNTVMPLIQMTGVEKIFVRSLGFASSCQESICIRVGDAPAMKGANDAADTFAISASNSTSGALWSKW